MNAAAAGLVAIKAFDGARVAPSPQDRLAQVRLSAQALHERLMDEPPVRYARSIDLLRVPYPASYAFTGVYSQRIIKPLFIHLLARMVVVQYEDFAGAVKTLLFNPADWEAGEATPYFNRLSQMVPSALRGWVAPSYATVPQALASIGVSLEAIDFITYDHLHTQDLRRWLGSGDTPGLFPNAKLLVHRQEWASAHGLLPVQSDWYCPSGIAGIPAERIIQFDGSVQLGRGVALVHTPGHTEGNHSLVWRTADGLRVSSENGVAVDSWSPLQSRSNAIRRYAQQTGHEVVLNGNTLESSVDQYISMVLEKTLAGSDGDGVADVVPSSECAPHWMFPGAPAGHFRGELQFGTRATA